MDSGYFGFKAVFRVQLEQSHYVYMSLDGSRRDVDRAIVFADSQKLLDLWRKEPFAVHTESSYGTPATWRQEAKFPTADRGFSFGYTNPVPLAKVKCDVHESVSYVAFGDGITRTCWLLAHGARCIPIECDYSSGAERLASLAGYREDPLIRVSSLWSVP